MTPSKGLLTINQRVRVKGKPDIRVIIAFYRVEIWLFYELQGLEGFLIRDDRLEVCA